MKVWIGPYTNWIGPYQIVDKIFFWHEKYPEGDLENRWDYKLHDKFADWLAETWVAKFCEWIHSFKKRRIYVKVDRYDHWNLDSTLAPIILPLLKDLRKHKHGSGYIDLEDVPEEMRTTSTEDWDGQKCFDFYSENIPKGHDIHTRYEWALDEMIWAFEQLNDENNGEDQFWLERGEVDWNAGEVDEKGCKPIVWKKESKVDWDGLKAHQQRIRQGTTLFGKYFQTLWD